jgi:hypothetical protein
MATAAPSLRLLLWLAVLLIWVGPGVALHSLCRLFFSRFLLTFLDLFAVPAASFGVEINGVGGPNTASVFAKWTPAYLFARDDVRCGDFPFTTRPEQLRSSFSLTNVWGV